MGRAHSLIADHLDPKSLTQHRIVTHRLLHCSISKHITYPCPYRLHASSTAMPGPVAVARPRRERLQGLNDPNNLPAFTTSTTRNSPPTVPAPPKERSRYKHKCPVSDDPIISSEDGSSTCYSCGQVLAESEIVAEVTFAETSSGAARVEGAFVGDEQRHANTMGGTMRGLGGMESRQKTLFRGRDEIRKLAAALHLREAVESLAFSLYKLASGNGFVQGRRVRNVAACTLYLADRRQPQSTLLLMDLSEKIHVNVWTLGETYKQFLKIIMLPDPQDVPETQGSVVPQLEPLILKFCRKLEFEESDTYKVADDACKLLKRMRRDWMIEGRNPAGLCGACIILAARMNNYRRTVREVVYIVHVADSTINHRLHEFKRTKSSLLTVDQFRTFGLQLKDDVRPPAIYRREEREERKRKRAAQDASEEDVAAEAEVVAGPSSSTHKPTQTWKKRKTGKGAGDQPNQSRDEDGFLIPDISMNPNATADDAVNFENDDHLDYVAAITAPEEIQDEDEVVVVPKKKRGRPRKREAIVIADEDLEIEQEIEEEMMQGIRAWENVFKEFAQNENHPVLKAAGAKAKALSREYMPNANVNLAEVIHDEEFADDEDVMNCLNTPAEVRMKEKVWVTENEDWLRAQQKKLHAKALEEAQGVTKKPKQRRNRSQMGDGSVLGGKPAASPREAVHKMMQKRAKHFSTHINYDKLKELFPGAEGEDEGTQEGSTKGASPAGSVRSKQAAQEKEVIEIQDEVEEDDDAEGDFDEEEEYPQQGYEEEFDDPRQYMDDEEYGFDEADMNDDY